MNKGSAAPQSGTTEASVSLGAAPSLTANIIAAAIVAALVIWGKPYWLPWLAIKVNAAVQTSAQLECRP